MIEWENPPSPRRTVADYVAIVAVLRERPGEWARVYVSEVGDKKAAVAVAQGLRRRGVEATQRSIDPIPRGATAHKNPGVQGRHAVWAMVPETTITEVA